MTRFIRPESAAGSAHGLQLLISPLLVVSLALVPVTWWLPLFTARVPFLWRHEVSIASGLVELWRLDLLLFVAVLLFSVLAPLAKGLALVWVWHRMPRTQAATGSRSTGPARQAVHDRGVPAGRDHRWHQGRRRRQSRGRLGATGVRRRGRAVPCRVDLGVDGYSAVTRSRDRNALNDGQMSSRRSIRTD